MKLSRRMTALAAVAVCVGLVSPATTLEAAAWSPWTPRTAAEANAWEAVAYGNGTFVAVASSGTNRVMTSDDGITWTARTAPASGWKAVTFGNNLFVAVAQDGTDRLMTSPDGITWTAQTVPNFQVAPSWYGVVYGADKFVAVGLSAVMTSTDGTTWTAATAAQGSSLGGIWVSVAYGNNTYVATARTGTVRGMTSPDGVTWTNRSIPAGNWENLVFGGGKFVSVAGVPGSDSITTSDNGVSWATQALADQGLLYRVFFVNNLFLAVTSTGVVYSSTDGATWTKREVASAGVQSIAFGEGLYVGVATYGTNRVFTTKDPLEAAPATTTTTLAPPTTPPTTLPPTTTTTAPKKQPAIPKIFGPNARRLAKFLDINVPTGAKVRTKVADSSKSICRVSIVGNLLAIKKGKCNVIITVTPAKGRPSITRATLTVS